MNSSLRSLSFIVPLILMVPTASIRWRADRQGLKVELEQPDGHLLECIKGGLEVRYRLELKVCRQRSSWFDKCGETQLLTRSVQYDPISENYTLTTDFINDAMPPTVQLETDADKAEREMQEFSISGSSEIRPEDVELIQQNNIYVGVRVRGYCQRDDQSLVAQIPYYLTFGIFRFAGFDTGWVDYQLTE